MNQVESFLQENNIVIRELRNLELIRLQHPEPLANARNAVFRIYRELLENFESTFCRISSTTQLLYWGFIRTRIAGLYLEAGDEKKARDILEDMFVQANSIAPVSALLDKLRFPEKHNDRASNGAQLDRSDILVLSSFAGLFQTAFNLMAACSLSHNATAEANRAGELDPSTLLHWLHSAKRLHELYTEYNQTRVGPTFWETITFKEYVSKVGTPGDEIDWTQEMSTERLLFEHGYTTTLFLLAQAYQLTHEPDHSASCCQLTLARQLNFARPFHNLLLVFGASNPTKSRRPASARRFRDAGAPIPCLLGKPVNCLSAALQPFNRVEWVANAASLGRYYASVEQTTHAYYGTLECFVSACAILDGLGPPQPQIPPVVPNRSSTKPSPPSTREQRIRADLYRSLAEFGLNLLELGGQAVKETPPAPQGHNPNTDRPISTSAKSFGCMFQLNLHPVLHQLTEMAVGDKSVSDDKSARTPVANETSTARPAHTDDGGDDENDRIVTDLATCPSDYSTASRVFRLVANAIDQAEQFYTMEDRCSEAVALAQSRSKAYRLLANFEPVKARQCRMHKRRVDVLSHVLKPLNRQHYQLLCRQLLFELAEALSSLRDLKQEIYDELLNQQSKDSAHYARKANQLAKQALLHYKEFLGTFNRPKRAYPEDEIRQVMLAHFYSARLLSRLITVNGNEQVKNLTKSLTEYRTVVALIDDHLRTYPNSAVRDAEEVSIARDMCNLLPVRLTRLARGEQANVEA